MFIELFLAGCACNQPDGEGQMVEAKHWDWMVWTTEQKALTRYAYWKEGHFKDGTMSQIAVVRIVIDLFNPQHNQIAVIASASHPFQKTVVYNKQVDNFLAQGDNTNKIGQLIKAKLAQHQPTPMEWDFPEPDHDEEPEHD